MFGIKIDFLILREAWKIRGTEFFGSRLGHKSGVGECSEARKE